MGVTRQIIYSITLIEHVFIEKHILSNEIAIIYYFYDLRFDPST